jgi:hypothetical protein
VLTYFSRKDIPHNQLKATNSMNRYLIVLLHAQQQTMNMQHQEFGFLTTAQYHGVVAQETMNLSVRMPQSPLTSSGNLGLRMLHVKCVAADTYAQFGYLDQELKS